MARKSKLSSNPIRLTRVEDHKTLEEFAQNCHIHLQAVYLNEMGMYPTVLPSIMLYLTRHYNLVPEQVEEEYQYYVYQKRSQFGERNQPYVLGEPVLGDNPFLNFRHSLGYTTAFGFARDICINPTTVRRVEKCRIDVIPKQLKTALRDIQLSPVDIEELECRHQEYFYRGSRFKSRSKQS